MKRVTVRTRSYDSPDGTHYTEIDRTEETASNGLFEAWGAFMLLFLTLIGCTLLVRVVLPSPPSPSPEQTIKQDI